MKLGLFSFATLLLAAGCDTETVQRNPFLGYTEEYGAAAQLDNGQDGGAGGAQAGAVFRQNLTLTLRNSHSNADLQTSLLAWVEVSSISSAEQQDALFQGGYDQLSREVRIGSGLVLPIGTFVYQGGGNGGAIPVNLARGAAAGEGAAVAPSELVLTLVTPDGVLIFRDPPVSCDSVAFVYTDNGRPLNADPVPGGDASGPFGGSNTNGPYKTLAQIDAFQCDPFEPGLFFSRGGARDPNQFFEGQPIAINFLETADDTGSFAQVTIGSSTPTGDSGG